MLAHFADNIGEAQTALNNHYRGVFRSLADYARETVEDSITVDAWLAAYIDYGRLGRDMEMSGDITTINTAHDEVHIFANC
jgi:antirestriction protein